MYKYFNNNPNGRSVGDCAVRAIAAAFNVTWDDAFDALAQCCCDNRLATNDLKATLASEACATRAANTPNTQMILDKLCALEIDGLKERNATLLADNNALKFAASQTAQNGFIQRTVADAIQYVHPAPIPAYIVANPNVTPTTAA